MKNKKNKNKKYFLALALLLFSFIFTNSQYHQTPTSLFKADIFSLQPNEEEEIEFKIKNKPEWDILSNYSARNGKSIFNSPEIKIDPNDPQNIKTKIKTPSTPGAFTEIFMPRSKENKWIRKDKIVLSVVVDGDFSESYNYEIIDNKSTYGMIVNGTKDITFRIKNTGTAPWYNNMDFPLYLYPDEKTDTPQFYNSDTWLSDKIIGIMWEKEVDPGEIATFNFKLSAPPVATDYKLGFKLAIKDIYTFPNPIFLEIKVNNKQVALTFDDGYGEIDPFLNLLNQEGVRGTFFILGCVAQARPDQMRRIVNEGHLLANHSYCHPDFRTLTDEQILWQLSETRKIMEEITGNDVYPYFRYPYGARDARTDAVLEQEGWKIFHWTQSTGDYKRHENSAAGRQQVYYYSTRNPPDQSIVLMHIISKSSLAALPDIIQWYRDHGYTFVTVDEL